MIDFIKLRIPMTYADELRNNSLLQFHTPVNLQTGERGVLESAEYCNIKVVISPKQLLISGSIHKFSNEYFRYGSQNHDDFTTGRLRMGINALCQTFGFDPGDAEVQNIEFGVNIAMEKVPHAFLKENLVSYRGKAPSRTNRFNGKGYFTEFTCNQYYLKVYDKSLQFKLDRPVLRVEIKTRRSAVVRRCGIRSLADLRDQYNLMSLKDLLLKRLEKLLLVDGTDFDFIACPVNREFLYRYINPRSFEAISSGRQRTKIRNQLDQKLNQYQLLDLKSELKRAVDQKWDQLLRDVINTYI